MGIVSNLEYIKSTLPDTVKLVAVSKFHPAVDIQEAYNAGQLVFGESRMQELDGKHTVLPQDIEWHFIGHLQTNKVKSIIPYIHTIHSIDSWKLLAEIERQAAAAERRVNCLLEIHIAQEDSKYGLSEDECFRLVEESDRNGLEYAKICGVMGMATYADDETLIRNEFKQLKNIFTELKNRYFAKNDDFREISMGMSHDYQIAVEEGSTMVRIGSSIFGERF